MIDRSRTTHPDLSGADYVLEGASIRDRFLTAFILRYNEAGQSAWLQAASLPVSSHAPEMSTLLPAEDESVSIHVEREYEPLTVQVMETWFDEDDDDDTM